jgi:hypothetical protein
MHISLRTADNSWSVIRVPLVATGVYLVLVGAAALLAQISGAQWTTCPFRLLTGLPCATCGATRMALAFSTGHFSDAWRLNPLLASAFPIALLWLAVRCTGRRIAVELSKPARYVVCGFLAVAVLANWAYLIAVGR